MNKRNEFLNILCCITICILLSSCNVAQPTVEKSIPPGTLQPEMDMSPQASLSSTLSPETAKTSLPSSISKANLKTPSTTAAQNDIHEDLFAGTWYPGDADTLRSSVDGFLATVRPVEGAPIGLVVPHAGYAYSGQVAAVGFKQMENQTYDTAIILSMDHNPPISNPVSIWEKGAYQTPLGTVKIDEDLAKAITATEPLIQPDQAAQQNEHMIEIELPFLQRVCPNCKIIPILIGTDDDKIIDLLSQALLSNLTDKHVVLIASTDLSHYPKEEDALKVDGKTLAAIESGDPDMLQDSCVSSMAEGIPNLVTCACSEAAVRVVMKVAKGLGANMTTLLYYSNSGEVSGGDKQRVVGYGAVMMWHYEAPELTVDQRKKLLEMARDAIRRKLNNEATLQNIEVDDVLKRKSGVFVTLNEKGELRGCIGSLWASTPLYQAVEENAIAAAFSDPRFSSLKEEELKDIDIEISVLSPLAPISDTKQIEIGKHGLMIQKNGQRGVFLPQVPVEQGWDLQQYLDNLCLKAGLEQGCWKENASLYSFTAVVFGEKDIQYNN